MLFIVHRLVNGKDCTSGDFLGAYIFFADANHKLYNTIQSSVLILHSDSPAKS